MLSYWMVILNFEQLKHAEKFILLNSYLITSVFTSDHVIDQSMKFTTRSMFHVLLSWCSCLKHFHGRAAATLLIWTP